MSFDLLGLIRENIILIWQRAEYQIRDFHHPIIDKEVAKVVLSY
jgi:hypothetical protein